MTMNNYLKSYDYSWVSLHGIVINELECNIVISEFKLQSCYYIHFQINILWRGMNTLILSAMD